MKATIEDSESWENGGDGSM